MSNRILYFECYSGISGDMTVASLLDLGADRNVLMEALSSLNPEEFTVETKHVLKNGISALDFNVIVKHIPAHHVHRNLNDIFRIIDNAKLTQEANQLSKKIFTIVAEAESEAHALPIDQVHFHEVGAIDSIVDIVSVAVCLDNLGVEKAVFSTISEGSGYVECQHGMLPVPVPAVTNIVRKYGLPVKITQTDGEMITPTGAAIAAAIRSPEELPSGYRILKTGCGAGKRVFPNRTNILRTYFLEEVPAGGHDEGAVLLECNIDDMTGEELGLALRRILDGGAFDAWFTPIFMKKNRPAWMLSAICPNSKQTELENILLRDTSTIGIRFRPLNRVVMHREIQKFESSLGTCNVKICSYGDLIKASPEYDDAVKIADKFSMSLNAVYRIINSELHEAKAFGR